MKAAATSTLSAATRLRVAIRMLTARHGTRTTVARGLAKEIGCSLRTIFRWRQTFKKRGPSGLVRKERSSKGFSTIYNEPDFERAIAASIRLRRPHANIHAEWVVLALPGSYETFRCTVRKLQAFGFVDPSPVGEKEKNSA